MIDIYKMFSLLIDDIILLIFDILPIGDIRKISTLNRRFSCIAYNNKYVVKHNILQLSAMYDRVTHYTRIYCDSCKKDLNISNFNIYSKGVLYKNKHCVDPSNTCKSLNHINKIDRIDISLDYNDSCTSYITIESFVRHIKHKSNNISINTYFVDNEYTKISSLDSSCNIFSDFNTLSMYTFENKSNLVCFTIRNNILLNEYKHIFEKIKLCKIRSIQDRFKIIYSNEANKDKDNKDKIFNVLKLFSINDSIMYTVYTFKNRIMIYGRCCL